MFYYFLIIYVTYLSSADQSILQNTNFYNSANSLGICLLHGKQEYFIEPKQNNYSLTGITVPLAFTKIQAERITLISTVILTAYEHINAQKVMIPQSQIPLDIKLDCKYNQKNWKSILLQLYDLELNYSMDHDWQVKYTCPLERRFNFVINK